MLIENQTKIDTIINESLRSIPTLGPLHQFVATNPLWDKIDKSFYDATSELKSRTKINDTLSLSEYWSYYQEEKIKDEDIHKALALTFELLESNNKQHQLLDVDKSLYKQLVYGFMTDKVIQDRLVSYAAKQKRGGMPSILVSNQLNEHPNENPILNDCQRFLSSYYNPKGLHDDAKVLSQSTPMESLNRHDYPLFHFWLTLFGINNTKVNTIVTEANGNINRVISMTLKKMDVPENAYQQYIFEIIWQMKGWLGYLKWQQNHPNNPFVIESINPKEVIAIWLLSELAWLEEHTAIETDRKLMFDGVLYQSLLNDLIKNEWKRYIKSVNRGLSEKTATYIVKLTQHHCLTEEQLQWYWHTAYEQSYQRPLFQSLLNEKKCISNKAQISKCALSHQSAALNILSQWVFCIDVRSEGFRRHLEQGGNHITYGYAGFFGFPYQLAHNHERKDTYQCPALIEPQILVKMISTSATLFEKSKAALIKSFIDVRKSYAGSFFTYEMIGVWYSLTLLFKSYGAQAKALFHKMTFNSLDNKVSNTDQTPFEITITNASLNEQSELALGLLKSMGLTKHFAKVVVICGHTAQTENNPFQAALDCGACGGNSGMTNAVLAAQVLNQMDVRTVLLEKGIMIPADTVFIAACHNTTTDDIHWYDDLSNLKPEQQVLLNKIKKDALKVKSSLNAERRQSLHGEDNLSHRAKNWSELMPEWGLINNAAMVIGSRELTANLDLQRRVFLHSYCSDTDPDGAILENILLGPVVVGHWINMQYYFSSVEPKAFGSGDKSIHNILPNIGVMEGNQSDLKYGLPKQSVFFRNKRMHDPFRLTVYIDAPASIIKRIIEKHDHLNALVKGQWLWIKSLEQKVYA